MGALELSSSFPFHSLPRNFLLFIQIGGEIKGFRGSTHLNFIVGEEVLVLVKLNFRQVSRISQAVPLLSTT